MHSGSLLTKAKGRFAETIVSTLLEYAGYRVLRLGVEETISEVKAALARGEHLLQLPEQLRVAPDFIVIDAATGVATLLEVKFRGTFDNGVAEELYAVLSRQVALWPETVTAIVCASPPDVGDGGDIRAHIRCLRSGDLTRLIENHDKLTRWQRLGSLGGVFERLYLNEGLYAESEGLVAPIRGWA